MKFTLVALCLTAIVAAQAATSRVFIIEGSLPQSVKYSVLGDMTVSSIFYGSSDALLPKLADKARRKGANAVINTHSYLAPSGFAWAAPHVSGQAVRLDDPRQLDRLRVHYKQF